MKHKSYSLKESILKTKIDSQFDPDPLFISNLKTKLEEKAVENNPLEKISFVSNLFRLKKVAIAGFVITILMFIVFGSPFISNKIIPHRKIYTFAQVKEALQKQIAYLSQNNIIVHRKNRLTLFENGKQNFQATYELWEDNSSDLFRNEVTYADDKVVQIKGLKTRWDYSEKEKTLIKEIYVEDNEATPSASPKLGKRAELLSDFQEIVDTEDKSLSLKQETLNDMKVVILTKEGHLNDGDKILKTEEKYFFEETSLKLVAQKVYLLKDNGTKELISENEELLYEGIEKTDENIQKLFTFDLTLPIGTKIIERHMQTGKTDEFTIKDLKPDTETTPSAKVKKETTDEAIPDKLIMIKESTESINLNN